MENPFCVGEIAEGDGFVGRREKLREFRQKLLAKKRGSISICGLPRVGKSSLIHQLLHNSGNLLEKEIVVAEVDLGKCASFFMLWRKIAKQLRGQLQMADLLTEELIQSVQAIIDAGEDYEELSDAIDTLFEELKEDGVKTILYIDEFDYVAKVFGTGAETDAYCYSQLLRGLATEARYNVSFIIVSRRSLAFLEERCCGGSALHLAMDAQQLTGFDDDEVREMRTLLERYEVSLTDEEWCAVRKLGGRIPFLLSTICKDLVVRKGSATPAEIIEGCYPRMLEYYEEIGRLLQDEGFEKRMCQVLCGPKYNITPAQVREMESRGYLRQDGDDYEAISEGFAEYFRQRVRGSVAGKISPLMTETERLVRGAITVQMKKKFGDRWESAIEEEYEERRARDPEKYRDFVDFQKVKKFLSAAENANYAQGSSLGILNMMSFGELFNIISVYWSDFAADNVFGGKQLSELGIIFKLLQRARNPLAHSNIEYLTTAEITQVDGYCQELVDLVR